MQSTIKWLNFDCDFKKNKSLFRLLLVHSANFVIVTFAIVRLWLVSYRILFGRLFCVPSPAAPGGNCRPTAPSSTQTLTTSASAATRSHLELSCAFAPSVVRSLAPAHRPRHFAAPSSLQHAAAANCIDRHASFPRAFVPPLARAGRPDWHDNTTPARSRKLAGYIRCSRQQGCSGKF